MGDIENLVELAARTVILRVKRIEELDTMGLSERLLTLFRDRWTRLQRRIDLVRLRQDMLKRHKEMEVKCRKQGEKYREMFFELERVKERLNRKRKSSLMKHLWIERKMAREKKKKNILTLQLKIMEQHLYAMCSKKRNLNDQIMRMKQRFMDQKLIPTPSL